MFNLTVVAHALKRMDCERANYVLNASGEVIASTVTEIGGARLTALLSTL
jgi:hypothetical protein